ncbi:hypothetical protein HDU87_003381 [Geranomyces variabilis]|uniref:Ribonucleotide reductase large subunit C-terminal domain-containing protein n=1 Tax=Geranomyces variabilis TaxID=109894 RepID=A0AAD5TK88_9FUNG|nr:hypothetical protein HDU87_003381 [Geranomyces variabilis]
MELIVVMTGIRKLYKISWDLKMRTVIDLAADRGPYVDQSQSMNLIFAEPEIRNVTSALFAGCSRGLKTGQYYLRQPPPNEALKMSVGKMNIAM